MGTATVRVDAASAHLVALMAGTVVLKRGMPQLQRLRLLPCGVQGVLVLVVVVLMAGTVVLKRGVSLLQRLRLLPCGVQGVLVLVVSVVLALLLI
jgi:hypothetical protein